MTTHDRPLQQQLASDNYAGLCPEALAALEQANQGHAPSYGQDRWTAEACDRFRDAVRDALRSVFRLQRHGGQRAGPGQPVPVLSQHRLPSLRPHRD